MMSYHWRMFKENIGVDQVIEPGGTICFGARWVGEKEVIFHSDWKDGHDGMIRAAHALLSEADAVVTFNGDRFDIPKLTGEFLLAGLPPPPSITSIDLIKTIKYRFGFDSNRLAFVGPLLDVGKKMKHEGFDLWVKVMNGDVKAQAKMEKYCNQDVKVTEALYKRIRSYITTHPALRAIGSTACTKCGNKTTQRRGYRYTACYRIQRLQCTNCHGWSSGKKEKVA